MIDIKELHDATLLGFEFAWGSGDLWCNFKVSIGERTTARLLARGVTLLKCPREFSWGRSASVNTVRLDKLATGVLLIIGMQSGDTIEANAQDVILE